MKRQALVLLASVVFLSGCSTLVSPKVTTFSAVRAKSAKTANLVIAEETLTEKEAVHFGIVGFLFPITMEIGNLFQQYAESNMATLFETVKLNDTTGQEDVTVELKMDRFEIIGMSWHAVLDMTVNVSDKDGEQLFSKTYNTKGPKSFIGGDQFVQRAIVVSTTEEAFLKAFSELTDDLRQLNL